MEQFSHDLTLALEETSRVRAGHCWGVRRRTRSTGNLPCAPQPTEDSSSSPADGQNETNECPSNSILSDSDDRQNFQLALKARQTCLFGNFESDSLNENFSPTRPNTRRKRKFKRMAVEYETTPSTPGNTNPTPIFPLTTNVIKKRVMKHTSQENFRASLFFCGKRKRSHRDRYHDYEHYRLHSSSVPRQREFYAPKNSYLEYKNRNRNSYSKPCERILPLNKNIVSKIEKISKDSNKCGAIGFMRAAAATQVANHTVIGFPFDSMCLTDRNNGSEPSYIQIPARVFKPQCEPEPNPNQPVQHINVAQLAFQSTVPAKTLPTDGSLISHQSKLSQKSGSFESTFNVPDFSVAYPTQSTAIDGTAAAAKTNSTLKVVSKESTRKGHHHLHTTSSYKQKQSKRFQMKLRLQFDDPNGMDCGNLNDFLSSSSLSSSDSEAAETNESDREGDDELTDWPGNEAMVNFASKNDFKRAKPARSGNNPISTVTKSTIPISRGVIDEAMGQDEDTLMSADELSVLPAESHFSANATTSTSHHTISAGLSTLQPPSSLNLTETFSPALNSLATTHEAPVPTNQTMSNKQLAAGPNRMLRNSTSMPIDIAPQIQANGGMGSQRTQIESEMSGETSNHFLSSPSTEVREIRAGCRRIRDERPGFSIFTSVNEHLSRFLQDSRQSQLFLPYTDNEESEKLNNLAKLYSLKIQVEDGRAIFTKTINTTQSVKIDQTNMSKFFLSDYKRRCYGAENDSESTEMAS